MIRNGETAQEKALIILLNKCVVEGKIYKTWKNAEVIIIFKKEPEPTLKIINQSVNRPTQQKVLFLPANGTGLVPKWL